MSYDLRHLTDFGRISAEDDAVLQYFLRTDEVSEITRENKFLVIGRKGSGKTAIARYFNETAHSDAYSRPLNLRNYPWQIHARRMDSGANAMEAYVASWKYLIAVQLASLVLDNITDSHPEKGKILESFLTVNYGGTEPELGNILRPGQLRLNETRLEPSLFGVKLGSISFHRDDGGENLGAELNALTTAIFSEVARIARANNFPKLYLHFDELDRGLKELDDSKASMLVGLILAARESRIEFENLNVDINAVVYLRSDLWQLLRFSDKNKISQSSTIKLEWSPDKLRELIELRLDKLLSSGAKWSGIEDDEVMRGGQKKWNHVCARTFLRPRDVIAFLNAALKIAQSRHDDPLVFTNRDITGARENYSVYLKQELDDEIAPHLPEWEHVLQVFSAISTLTFDRDQFEREYIARCSSDSVTTEQVLEKLFEFSVISYQRISGYGGSEWIFQYTNPEAQWDRTSKKLKVHPGLKEFAQLKEEREGRG